MRPPRGKADSLLCWGFLTGYGIYLPFLRKAIPSLLERWAERKVARRVRKREQRTRLKGGSRAPAAPGLGRRRSPAAAGSYR